MRRVVVTGLGLVSPLGCAVEAVWRRLCAGGSGAGAISRFDASALPSRIACEVPSAGADAFDLDAQGVSARERRAADDFAVYALAAAGQAIRDSGFVPADENARRRAGVAIGSGFGGTDTIEKGVRGLVAGKRLSPFFIPRILVNMASGQVSIKWGFRGPNIAPVGACATGAQAMGDAARLVALGDADVMVAGGSEAALTYMSVAGFCACRALSTGFNDDPTRASRPYDKDRDGFVIGEGAGIVVLEALDHARARGAEKMYGEVAGYGLSGDAHHITAPADDGDGAYRAMEAALARAGVAPEEIDYVNAHGTSTPLGDEIELRAVERLFGDAAKGLTMSSTKSATGHLLGAAGSMEAIFCLLAMRDGLIPPTINLDNPSVNTPIDLVPHKARQKPLRAVLNNAFGFGGTNASLVFTQVS